MAGLISIAGTPARAQSWPPEVFASLPAMESPSISADGRRVAFIAHADGQGYVLVANIDGMQVTSVMQVSAGKLQRVFWANDEALVFTARPAAGTSYLPGRPELGAPYGIDLENDGIVTRLLQDRDLRNSQSGGPAMAAAAANAQLAGFDRGEGRVLYPRVEAPEFDRVLYAIDPKTDRQTVVDRGARSTVSWVLDEDGAPVYRIDAVQRAGTFTILGRQRGQWNVAVTETAPIPELAVFGFDAQGRVVVMGRPGNSGLAGLYDLSVETGQVGAPLASSDRFDVEGARVDPYTNRVIGASIAGEPVWFDPDFVTHQELLDEAFPGENPSIVSWSEDRSLFIVVTNPGNLAPAVYLYNSKAPSVDQIGSYFAALQGQRLPSREPYEYVARDGTAIPGYLTRPVNAGSPVPLVVLPHSGPGARDMPGFDWMAHFLATRGYAVLQPNYRGSGGYGRAWEAAGFGQWGTGVMQHDLTDGVAALVEAGIADEDRVCIVGSSYGGYAALAGAAFTPDVYRCAASIAGITDLVEVVGVEGNRRGRVSAAVAYWRRAMGGGEADGLNDRLRAASPVFHAGDVEASVLLIHTAADEVVPIAQSRAMETALNGAGKNVEFVELEGEDHWLATEPTRIAALRALDAFLAAQLGD